jgi:muramidase (phage lysozyme)
MDRTVPAPAAYLLNFIGWVETREQDGNKGYDTIWGHRQRRIDALKQRPISQHTVAEWLNTMPWWSGASSASGRYQFMKATLMGLAKELRLQAAQVMDGNLQDRLGYHLLKRRGYDRWIAGQMTDNQFMLNLAKEWASLPVPFDVNGRKKGQSYYGDKLNKALIPLTQFQAALNEARAEIGKEPPMPEPTTPPVRPPVQPLPPVIPVPMPPGDPPALPALKSETLVLAVLGFIASVVGLFKLWKPELSFFDNFENIWPLFLSAFTTLMGAYKRYVSEKQPITFTQAGADQLSAEIRAKAHIQNGGVPPREIGNTTSTAQDMNDSFDRFSDTLNAPSLVDAVELLDQQLPEFAEKLNRVADLAAQLRPNTITVPPRRPDPLFGGAIDQPAAGETRP